MASPSAYPHIIDFDKLVDSALRDIGGAVRGWLGGQPRDEVALMNRLTERLARRRRGCDVGVRHPVTMRAEVYVLHRKGQSSTDKYGSDLAVTLSVPELSWFKTSLFQLKRSQETQVLLERRQLNDAARDQRILSRSFVLAVDETRAVMRLESTKTLWHNFPCEQDTQKVDCDQWTGLVNWMDQWFRCEIGQDSKRNDPNAVEPLLRHYIVEPSVLIEWFPEEEPNLPEDFLPARSWLHLLFRSSTGYEELETKWRMP